MSNFAFLQAEWPLFFEAASKAEGLVNADARASCFYARRTLELAVAWMYAHDKSLRMPYQDNLSAFIHEPSFKVTVGDALFAKARLIKDLGNLAVHSTRKVAGTDAVNALRELFHFCYWLARTYGRTARPSPNQVFSAALLPTVSGAAPQSVRQLQKLEVSLKERDDKLVAALKEQATLSDELHRLRAEVTAAKKANTAEPDTHDYSEAETRKAFIDVLLKEAGWNLNPAVNFEVEVTGMPNNECKGYVDYVLWGDDGKPLALVEAKRTTKSSSVGQQQAKLYARLVS